MSLPTVHVHSLIFVLIDDMSVGTRQSNQEGQVARCNNHMQKNEMEAWKMINPTSTGKTTRSGPPGLGTVAVCSVRLDSAYLLFSCQKGAQMKSPPGVHVFRT